MLFTIMSIFIYLKFLSDIVIDIKGVFAVTINYGRALRPADLLSPSWYYFFKN
jgi:hypothetical protein